MRLVQVYKTIKSQVVEDVPEGDLIGLTAAAEMSKYTISAIMRMVERGALPEYRLSQISDDQQVFTSKAAVAALPPKPRKAKATKKRKGAK